MNDERRIARRILSGDYDAFEELIQRYKPYVFKIVAGMVAAPDVEEVAHETFIRVFKGLSAYRGEAPFQHWLSKVTVRTCYDYWRQRKPVPVVALSDDQIRALELEVASLRIAEEGAVERAKEIVDWALNHLSPPDRLAFSLLYLEEMSMKEVGQTLGWSLAQVKIRSYRARKKLRKLLKTELGR